MIRILLGDDHRIVREGIKQILADALDVCVIGEAQSGTEVLETVRKLGGKDGIDLVLLDIAMPGSDGLEVLQSLRCSYPALPVLMLSTYPEKQFAVRCLKLGAGGYLNKSADPDDMVAAIRRVAGGGVYVTTATAEALAVATRPAASNASGGMRGIDGLSHREYQVFRLLITGQTVRQIGAQLKLASNTVSTYRARILEKTGAKNDVELALLAERNSSNTPNP